MTRVIFYEKPGCQGGAKQKALLTAAGHEVVAYNLLAEPWTVEKLRSFFGKSTVAEWFNKSAPRIKSGEVVPEKVDADTALALMIQDPLLIRRPLLQVGDRREVGFDVAKIDAWIGLQPVDESQKAIMEELLAQNLQGCSHNHEHHHEKGKCKH
ncbi:nitrogenase-associated protein [Cylindrospermum stagnale PCC 7417]|uniref:Nitrogenase-associated protein n=1 Tax=Cylindrospermum stagnale PCC 7417 TaxID=56107 RepID=K9X5Z5_9NOST|nr:ArsC/Spx/MgsR family protein [Cylindrospermum stagnale]AFZ27514.1 nitrogenase-associated protein [Cylindrospermum stagnale PCC 7417]